MRKRIVSIALMLAMLLCLTACGGDQDKLVGKWGCRMDLADQINEEMALDEEMAEYLNFDSFEITVYMEFTKDGTYTMYADQDALQETLDAAVDAFADGMAKYLEAMVLQETGIEMSAEDILAASNITMDEMMAEAFPEGMAQEIAEGMEQEGKFKAKDGKLFTSAGLDYNVDPQTYETYELSGTTLTVTGYVGDDADEIGNVYPMIFNKVG